MKSYEQTLTLFRNYTVRDFKIKDAGKVKSSYIQQYIKYLRERGKDTASSSDKVLNNNYPKRREDYQKPDTTIANCSKNMKVFYFLKAEREITVNPIDTIEQIKPKRK
ncbi:hypothetical protein SAMN06295926_108104 [Lysinibacillus sp. AC-3]|nr:hypothetical protein SAMN06295926_108104 [Lysinibacillus sp. AC-3]